MNSPIPYFGGKSRMAQTIIGHIPEHKTYAEVFGGAAWVLFKKQPSCVETLNDLDKHLMNFYRVTKYHMEALVDEVVSLQPSRDVFYALRDDLERPMLTDIQRAAIYYYLQRLAFAGRPDKPTFSTTAHYAMRFRPEVARRMLPLVAARLKTVMLENLPWERFLKLYDSEGTFFFVDPPYMGQHKYRHNFKPGDFEAMASNLKTIKGRFLLTHTDSPDIRTIFKGFKFEKIEASYSVKNLSGDQKRMIGKEVLISNY